MSSIIKHIGTPNGISEKEAEELFKKQIEGLANSNRNGKDALASLNMVGRVDKDKGKNNTFLILLAGYDDQGEEIKRYEFAEGRDEAYETIKLWLGDIDLMESKIINDKDPLSSMIDIATFLHFVLTPNPETGVSKIYDPELDLDFYMPDEWYIKNNIERGIE